MEDQEEVHGPEGGRNGHRDGCWDDDWMGGDELFDRVREVVREGQLRRLVIRDEDRRTVVEVPLAVGVVGAVVAPAWTALGVAAALLSNCTIQVEREQESVIVE